MVTIVELVRCKMSSLKSPRIRQGKLDIESWFNTLDSRLVNACNGMLGDLYNSAIWICILFANNVVLTASMPLDAYLCVSWLHIMLRNTNHNATFVVT